MYSKTSCLRISRTAISLAKVSRTGPFTIPAKRAISTRLYARTTSGLSREDLVTRSIQRVPERHAIRTFHSTHAAKIVKPFLLADIGEGITECEVIQWFVEPGSKVEEFDKICEVQSDKASVEITSRFAGKIVKLHYQLNDIAKVGQPLVDIDTVESDTSPEVKKAEVDEPKSAPVVKNKVEKTSVPAQQKAKRTGPKLATPSVRRIAKENGINLEAVNGSGENGRVLEKDVLSFMAGDQDNTDNLPQTIPVSLPSGPVSQGERTETLSAIQKAMFKSMTRSLSIPQLGYKDDIELNAATEYRTALNTHISNNPTQYPFTKMTYLPIFIKCLSIALNEFPIMNASLTGDQNDVNSVRIVLRPSHNIGVAMDTPQGLVVPNIKDVQSKTILDIAAEVHRLTELGKKNALSLNDLKGGTITLSNIGALGGTYANPVVISSELAIVALGRMQTLPRFDRDGNIVPKQILPVSWSADHRLIDGATIARFGNKWKSLIENPALLASELR
ncbi:2-oxoacid dehydrogenases acyltransferase-domain-containing protein [Phycomyces nitens]|nr:2-oxoacid dehydrogenases acyltransferase-domain-containing protein [Phycomyces nitens]